MNKKLIISDLSLVYGNQEDNHKILSNINFDLEDYHKGFKVYHFQYDIIN